MWPTYGKNKGMNYDFFFFFHEEGDILKAKAYSKPFLKKNCPRCGGAVFKAEAVPCKDRLYHKKCASCASCEKKLTFNTIFNGMYYFYYFQRNDRNIQLLGGVVFCF